MAIINATASGNISNAAAVLGGISPQPGDTIRAGTFTVDININLTGIRFESNSTGFFRIRQTEIDGNNGEITLADCDFVVAVGTTACLQCLHNTGIVSIRDAIVASTSAGAVAIINSGSGSLTGRSATVALGQQQLYGVRNTGVGTVTFENATGGSFNFSTGIVNVAAGTVNVTNAYAGTSLQTDGVSNNSGTVNVTNAYGGTSPTTSTNCAAVSNYGSGSVNVENAYAGNLGTAPATRNTSSGFLRVRNAYGNNFGPSGGTATQCFAVQGSNDTPTMRTLVKRLFCGPFGAIPIFGAVFIDPAADNVFQFRLSPNGPTKTLVDSSLASNVPAPANVRAGTVYDNGDKVGTLAVPAANQTAAGVPVDNTVGTAVLTTAGVTSALTPVTEQLDDIKTTLADIKAKTDTIEPPASGPHRLTITALDAGDQVGGVLLRIVGVAGTLRTTTTDAATLIDLDPGDYSLRVSVPNGFAPIADIPVNDLDADRTITIPLTRTAIAPPAAGNLCAVALRVATASDTPLAAASVTAYLVTGPAIGDTLHNGPTEITTDANGLATLQLLRGQTYDLSATATVGGVTSSVTVRRIIPNASTANFGTLVAG